jgi:DNA-binding XRE family transcriptional regulator
MPNGGTIYALGAEGTSLVKIGSTKYALETRVKALQTGQPFPLYVVASVRVDADVRRIEQHVHRLLAQVRQRGEWFDITLDPAALECLVVRAVQSVLEDQALRPSVQHTTPRTPRTPQEESIHGTKTLGERILILRRRHAMTQRALATAAGLATNTIARLEQGDLHDLGGQALCRLADVLETSTDALLGRGDGDTQEVAL